MALKSLKDALVAELRDILSAEQQITKALPKLVKSTTHEELSAALENHLAETKTQIERLREALSELGQSERAKACEGMKGIIEENDEVVKEAAEEIIDAVIIAGCQKVEHYEIASYGTAIAWAEVLGEDGVAKLLNASLEEEKAADEKLSTIAESVNQEALEPTEAA